MRTSFDVVIWGAGISGSQLAAKLAMAGLSVALFPNGPATKPVRPGFSVLDGVVRTTADLERDLIDHARDAGVLVLDDAKLEALMPEIGPVQSILTTSGNFTTRCLVLADGSDPRIGRARRVLPDWDPWQLIHFAYARFPDVELTDELVLARSGSRGVLPWRGYRAGSMLGVGWFLEHEMESRVHVSELLTDVRTLFGVADIPDGETQIEVVPFEPRRLASSFCVDNVLSIGDLVGVVNPMSLRRTEISLKMAERMSDVIVEWLGGISSVSCDPRRVKAALSAFIGPEFHRDSGPPMPPVPRPPGRERRLGSIVQRLVDRSKS